MKFRKLYLPLAVISLAAGRDFSLPAVYSTSGEIRTQSIPLGKLTAGRNYSLLFSITTPASIGPASRVKVQVVQGSQVLLDKTLHMGDLDLYAPFYPDQGAPAELRLETEDASGSYLLRINRWPESVSLKRGRNHTWQNANPMMLGQTVFASDDETPYIPVPGTSRRETATGAAGEDWYRFEFDSPRPKLVFFQLELMDRDDLPVDVSLFRDSNGKLQEYIDGQDPVAAPHEVQAIPGNKFAPRILKEKGTYYVRVRANHPEYKLRTRLYDTPPYSDPHQAVRAGVDYIMGAGDSWFANTPRRGGVFDRVASVHQETSLCVACHPSHFSQRAQLYAAKNGYPVAQREQLQFLEERFYNNPRPFYGFEREGAVWSRVISAPANVLSRMSVLTSLFEQQVSGAPRPDYHAGIADYLKLYYSGRDKLPPDETNGNTPLVSAQEVAWYSWKTTHDPLLPGMIAQAEPKNMIDLCYQTQALADIDPVRYKDQIRANADRILSLQRPDGQWSMKFEASAPEVEFQTGHALWALSSAGVPVDNPQVRKAVEYLLKRQQGFGGWMDPLQSFENFRTPFRETQFAVLALSSYYPLSGRAKGWNAARIDSLSKDPAQLLGQLDGIWDAQPAEVVNQIQAATQSNDVLVRHMAAQALGRLASPSTAPLLVNLLGDPSKLVQRTAAWSLRRIYAEHPDAGDGKLLAALSASDARTRWGATRVFAHHFSTLARRDELVAALAGLTSDPVTTVRMQAIKGLWQAWFWNADVPARNRIEDSILSALKVPQSPWIESNLHAAVYNLADENIRYLYNNWVALLGRAEDRDRAIQGRLAVESRLASKFAAVLTDGPVEQKKQLLSALTQFPLRRGDVYDLNADLSKPSALIYSRIGNDIEQSSFFGSSANLFARALAPLLDSPDPEMRSLAMQASLLVREPIYKAVDLAAGGRGENSIEIGKKLNGEVAKAFHAPVPKTAVAAAARLKESQPLDEPYFRTFIEPILKRKGKDGYACIDCHATHTLFNATWATVANVVNTKDPENSLILRKPTSTAESEGVAGAKTTAHGGGQRWPKGSKEYETILKWIEGARLESAVTAAPR